ncbi:MAG: hypothetical protein EOP51_12325 [Sphingobacteriales bacterium]|nr:MAG: hypothetical protein EOP51_12325 [Sphingobacteriales bacterium]
MTKTYSAENAAIQLQHKGNRAKSSSHLLSFFVVLLLTVTNSVNAQTISLNSQTNVLCFGSSTGAIDIEVAGGVGSLSYTWSNGATTQDISGLAAGNYSVVVTDDVSSTAPFFVVITEPATAVSVSLTSQTNVLCFGSSTGAIDITASGGAGSYTYVWTGAGITTGAEDQAGLGAGNYSVIVTDANSCSTVSLPITITQPTSLVSVALTSQTNVLCFGSSTGAIDITASGGAGSFTYAWTGVGITTGAEDQAGLAAGNYSVIVTDANSCSSLSLPVTITQPTALVSVALTSQTNVLCFGSSTGAINITPSGGTGPYTFDWADLAGTSDPEDRTSLAAGNYSVIVKDANGCSTASLPVTITQPTALVSVALTSQTNVLCFGSSTGAINITPSGGTGPYTFDWADLAGASDPEDRTNLAAGNYSVVVKDANGCTTASLPITITQPVTAPSVVLTSQTNVLCFGSSTGAINITASGGTGSYTYDWADLAGTSDPEDRTGLTAGNYSVIVKDANGCTTASLPITITQPATAVSITSITSNSPVCEGVNLNLNSSATGGTGTLTYLWTGPNSFTSGLQNPTITGATTAAAGTYNLKVTDGNSCFKTTTTSVTINARPTAVLSGTQTIFTGNAATLSIAVTGSGTISGTLSPGAIPFSGTAPTINLNVSPTITTTYTIATLVSNGCAANPGGISGNAVVTVKDNITITKTITTIPLKPGDPMVYQINYANLNASGSAINLVVIDTLPGANFFTYQSNTGSGVFNNPNRTVTWPTIPTLAAGASGSFTVTGGAGSLGGPFGYEPASYYMGSGGGTFNVKNKASITNPTLSPASIRDSIVTAVPQFCGSTFNPSSASGYIKASAGNSVYYLFIITNTGNIKDSFSLSASNLPVSQFNLISTITTLGGTTITRTPWLAPNETYTFLVVLSGSAASQNGQQNTIQLAAKSAVCGSINTANIATTGYNSQPPGNNNPNLRIVKMASVNPATVGTQFTYTLTVVNVSPNDAPAGFQVIDTIPATLQYVSASGTGPGPVTITPVAGPGGTTIITATSNTSQKNISTPVVISVLVNPSCTAIPTVKNKATVNLFSVKVGGNFINDLDPTNNVDSVSIAVNSNIAAASATSPTICYNNPVTLTASGALAGYEYKWYDASTGGTLLSALSTFTTPSLTANTTYYVAINQVGAPVCASSRTAVTVTVLQTPAFTTQPTDQSICGSTGVANFTASATGTGLTYTWQVSTDNGFSWNTLSNVAPYTGALTSTLSVTNPSFSMDGYLYKSVVRAGTCPTVPSNVSKLIVKPSFTWLGVNSNWNDPLNWCSGVPTGATSATIPVMNSPYVYPSSSTGLALVNNLTIANGATLTINGYTMQVKGAISSNGGINASNGILEFKGSSPQAISGSYFAGKNLAKLVVSNNLSAGGDTLNILDKISFDNNATVTLNSGDLIALKSSATQTASVGKLSASNTVNGKFIIERYIKYYQNWNMVTAPVSENIKVKDSWQEGTAGALPVNSSLYGYGTQITGPGGGNGLDASSLGFSMRSWNASSGAWLDINNTLNENVNRKEGFYLFVRGDRRYGPGAAGSTTTLRTKGTIYNATNSPDYTVNVAPQTFFAVANPFASATSLNKFGALNLGIEENYWIWDPTLSGAYGVGGYQSITKVTGFKATPGGVTGSNIYDTSKTYPNMQSGQAIYVRSFSNNPRIQFNEDMKADSSMLVNRGASETENIQMISTMIYTSTGLLRDGNRVVFDDAYSDAVDRNDAIKFNNNGVNFGLVRNTKNLSVEAKSALKINDTLFYRMSAIPTGDFKIGISAENLPQNGLRAELIDKFLNTRTAVSLNGDTYISFSTTAAATSKAADRFMLVFRKSLVVLPVNFVSISARRQADRTIAVNWKVTNEINIVRYEVERSADGVNFSGILTKAAAGTTSYDQADISPLAADNFYRIKAIGLGNDISYSAIVKVNGEKVSSTISVYPNPFVSSFTMSFAAAKGAPATLQLVNMKGQVVHSRLIQVVKGSNAIAVDGLPDLPGGSYQVIVTNQDLNIVGSIQK